jgi:hypothetical protein
MKKIVEILIFALALAAFVSCEKEPEPTPEPEPFNYVEYISGSWDWSPYEPDNPEHFTFTFESGRYTIEWHTADTTLTSNNPTFSIAWQTGVLTMQMATVYYYDYLNRLQKREFLFDPMKMDVALDEELILTSMEDPNVTYLFTRL